MPTVFPPVEEARKIKKEFEFSVFWREIRLPLTSTISAKRSLKKQRLSFFVSSFLHSRTKPRVTLRNVLFQVFLDLANCKVNYFITFLRCHEVFNAKIMLTFHK